MINFTIGLILTFMVGYFVISGCVGILKNVGGWFANLFKKGGKK